MLECGKYNFSVTAVVYHMYAATLYLVAYNVTNIDLYTRGIAVCIYTCEV